MPIPTQSAATPTAGTRWRRLLDHVLWRLRWAVVARRALYAFLTLSALYCALVLVARLTGLLPLVDAALDPCLASRGGSGDRGSLAAQAEPA